jgi:hypothetical protein
LRIHKLVVCACALPRPSKPRKMLVSST